jgi:DNA-binding response OmpR family regulator
MNHTGAVSERSELMKGPRTRTILLVEDDAAIVRVLRFSLSRNGFDVTVVGTAGEGLDLLQCSSFDAVIMDLNLPDARGGDLLGHLRKLDGKQRTDWLVISGHDRSDAEKQYGPLGGRFLEKPFDPWVLIRRLQQIN